MQARDRGKTACRQQDRVFILVGPERAIAAQCQDVAALNPDGAMHGIGYPAWQAHRQGHIIVTARREIMDDFLALCGGTIAEGPFENRALRQEAQIGEAETGVENPGLHRAAEVFDGLKQSRYSAGRGQIVPGRRGPGAKQVDHAARQRQKIMHAVMGGERRTDEDIAIIARGIGILILHEGILADRPAGLTGPAIDAGGQVAGDHHAGRTRRQIDPGDLDRSIRPIGIAAIGMQQRILPDHQTGGFAHGDAMQMAVGDHIVLNGDVAVEHLGTRQALIDPLVAHEDRLGPGSFADVQHIAADHDIGGGLRGARSPELDHVGMVARCRRAAEIMDLVAFDQGPLHLGKIHPVRAHGMQIIAGDADTIAAGDHQAAMEIEDLVAVNLHILGAVDRKPDAAAKTVVSGGHAAGDIAVESGVADGDVLATRNAEGGGVERGAGHGFVIADHAVQRQVRHAVQSEAAEAGRVQRVGRGDGDIRGEGDVEARFRAERQIAIISCRQLDRLAARGLGQGGVKSGQ